MPIQDTRKMMDTTLTDEYIGGLDFENILRRQIDRINWLFSIGKIEETLCAIEVLLCNFSPYLDEESDKKIHDTFFESNKKIEEIKKKIRKAHFGPYGKLDYLDESQEKRITSLEAQANKIMVEAGLKRLRIIMRLMDQKGLLLKEEKKAFE